MTKSRSTTSVRPQRFQALRGVVLAAMTAALLGAPALVADAHAAAPQTAAAQLEPACLGHEVAEAICHPEPRARDG